MKDNTNQTFINIPNSDPIPVGPGTVPVSGATVARDALNRGLKRAAKDNIVPLPQDNSGNLPEKQA